MRILRSNEDTSEVELTYDEVYLLLQCCMDTWDRLDEEDAETIIGSSRAQIRALSDELNRVKVIMR